MLLLSVEEAPVLVWPIQNHLNLQISLKTTKTKQKGIQNPLNK
jgi:hypothetical protein